MELVRYILDVIIDCVGGIECFGFVKCYVIIVGDKMS